MKKNVIKVFAVVLIALFLMVAEYCIIMRCLKPSITGSSEAVGVYFTDEVQIEVFGQVHEYKANILE